MKKILAIIALVLPFLATSCLKDEVYGGASISDIKNTTAYTASDDITVSAKVTALVPITSVNLVYKAGSSEQTVAMSGSETYTAVIPAQPLDTEVSYYIEASTSSMTVTSNPVKFTVGAVPIDYSGLILNELNGNDKFIELYNKGADIPTLAGLYIEKDGKNVWTGDGRSLKKGEYLLLYSTDVCVAGGAHEGYDAGLIFNSGLSAKKAVKVEVFTPAAVSLSVFDLQTVVKVASASYSRNKDGKWYHADATPGAANVEGTEEVQGVEGGEPVTPGSVMLSELNGVDKFIELANPGDLEIDITGYTIEKDGVANWTAAEGTKVPAHGYLLLYSTDVCVSGGAHEGYDANLIFNSGLSAKKAVKIELKNAGASSVEVFNLVTCVKTATASYSKGTDGKWYHAAATPGAENAASDDPVEGLE